jgi:hypothetical protein
MARHPTRGLGRYSCDFARALAAGESPEAFKARRKQVFRFLKRRASSPSPSKEKPVGQA